MYFSQCKVDEQGLAECFPDEEVQEIYGDMAAQFLWHWTRRQFGECRLTIRPCRSKCGQTDTFTGRGPIPGMGGYYPHSYGGQVLSIRCGACNWNTCDCETVDSLIIPGPVSEIEEILIDGLMMDLRGVRVDNYNALIRMDGESWPTCQNLALPTSEANTWQVTYLRGTPVPIGGQVAAGLLACEFYKAACKDRSCQLPERIKNITRQGVSVSLLDDFETLDQGKTGIWLIDSWVASVTRPQGGGTVTSVDVRSKKARRTTWAGV